MDTANPRSERMAAEVADAIVDGEYHFLDVGDEKYGECILAIFGPVRILIDGSHQGDIRGRNGRKSIPTQLAEVLGEAAPHRMTLVVVTHGHADHIGCLPDLLSNGVIEADWALLTDPKLGFGRTSSDQGVRDAVDPRYRLEAALREEDASDLTDDELRDFMDAVASVESRYARFIAGLKDAGTRVVLHQGKALPAELARLLKPTGAKLLGPSLDQLVFCAEQISRTNKDAADLADTLLGRDATMDDVALYRAVTELQDRTGDAIRNARGNGMNCQSITLAFGPSNARVLLAGDMQFAEPGVKGADVELRKLRQAVAAAGPYKVFKTLHHTSHNGQDAQFLAELGDPPIIVHSGGLRDASHPDPGILDLLRSRRDDIVFARTDRNGHITVRPHLQGPAAVLKSRGRFDNFDPNDGDAQGATPSPAPTPAPEAPQAGEQKTPAANAQIVIVNLPPGPVDMTVSGVDIVVRRLSPSSVAIERDPLAARPPVTPSRRVPHPPPAPGGLKLAAGRELPNLLFVTNSERLSRNIGSAEAKAALDAVRAAGQTVCEVTDSSRPAVATVHAKLASLQGVEGVIILGGYDVVPCNAVDVLGPELRREVRRSVIDADDDRFIVWSDEPYGDTDDDRIAELPVSRIPDARDAALFLTALSSPGAGPSAVQRFGVRNIARPFADGVWQGLSGDRALDVSERFLFSDVVPELTTTSQLHYFMLHGDWHDGRMFWGEKDDGYTDAYAVGNVPDRFNGVAFAGCCWGALTVSQKAKDAGAAPLAPRVVERSIALSYLKAGASAFVGCTGSHYSGPDTELDLNYAAVMHHAFWTHLSRFGFRPALALHHAREEYSTWIVSRASEMDPEALARRLKNRAQFTCLGFGW